MVKKKNRAMKRYVAKFKTMFPFSIPEECRPEVTLILTAPVIFSIVQFLFINGKIAFGWRTSKSTSFLNCSR
jgi:hypothetical protein